MMTNTYTEISANSLEWLRQWSAIIMMMEQSFDPKTRMRYQQMYSIPMEDGKRIALLLKNQMSVSSLMICFIRKNTVFRNQDFDRITHISITKYIIFFGQNIIDYHL